MTTSKDVATRKKRVRIFEPFLSKIAVGLCPLLRAMYMEKNVIVHLLLSIHKDLMFVCAAWSFTFRMMALG